MSNMNSNQEAIFQYDHWHGQFINYVLRALSILGVVLLISVFPTANNLERIAFGFIYLILLIVTLVPFSHRIKASVAPITAYLLGLYALLNYGPWSDATLLLLASVLFAGLLYNRRINRIFLVLCISTLISVGLLNTFGYYRLASPQLPKTGFSDWSIYLAGFIVVSSALTWAIELLKNEFKSVAFQYEATLDLLKKDKEKLEQYVEERTSGITKKTEQLRIASFIARQVSEAPDLSSLLEVVVNLITEQFGFYHTGIFLTNETGEEIILQTASSEGGKQMIARGYSFSAEAPGIINSTASQKKARIVLDVGNDAIFFNNPDLPMTRSEVALPLLVRNRVLGVLDIQSDQPEIFHLEDIDVLQTLADQIAIAIENARLLGETQAALMQLEAVSIVRTRDAWAKKLEDQNHVFTYTPLGVRAEGAPHQPGSNKVKTAITLRGQEIGSLSLTRKDNADWHKIDEELIEDVAYQIGMAVDNLRLLEDAQQRAKQEQTIGELATRFSQSLDIDSLLQTAARELGQMPDVSEVSVFIGQLPEQAPQRRRTKRATS